VGLQVGLKAAYDCIKAFSETDLTEDLKRFDVPTVIVQGDDDQIVPIANSGLLQAKLVPGARPCRSIPGPRTVCSRRTRTNSTPTCSPSFDPRSQSS
jgi:non-heme chloroperoxidase